MILVYLTKFLDSLAYFLYYFTIFVLASIPASPFLHFTCLRVSLVVAWGKAQVKNKQTNNQMQAEDVRISLSFPS